MHHTSVKGLKSTSYKYGQALYFTIVQTLAKALFGCGVFVGGFHILVHIISQLHGTMLPFTQHNVTMSSMSPIRQEKGMSKVQWSNFH